MDFLKYRNVRWKGPGKRNKPEVATTAKYPDSRCQISCYGSLRLDHSLSQRPHSFWSAPRIATPGLEPLGRSNTLSARFTDFLSLCACCGSSLTSVIAWEYKTITLHVLRKLDPLSQRLRFLVVTKTNAASRNENAVGCDQRTCGVSRFGGSLLPVAELAPPKAICLMSQTSCTVGFQALLDHKQAWQPWARIELCKPFEHELMWRDLSRVWEGMVNKN